MSGFLSFSLAKVLVVGDVMLDRYYHGDTSRISPEAPVPVVKVNKVEDRVGGAGNVALNVGALGGSVSLIGVIGDDEAGSILSGILENENVSCNFIKEKDIPTVTKARVIGRNQQLLRIDFEKDLGKNFAKVDELVLQAIKNHNVIILSDYAKGTIANPKKIINAAKELGVKVIIDPKVKDFSIYRGADLITPNLKEFEAAVGSKCTTLEQIKEKGYQLINEHNLGALLVTCGSKGMVLMDAKSSESVQIATQAREVFDVTGAGDTVIGVVGCCLASGKSLVESAKLANVAAGIVVGKLGATPICVDELNDVINYKNLSLSQSCVLAEIDLIKQVTKAKSLGQKIVMTNGCFDILHEGHITYLEQARSLGARLIVAVNDDLSVKKLKGDARPINYLAQRMRLLGALSCVDWVVAFSEDTPERLIKAITPDVLVKGGDYKKHEIAGAQHVEKQGGLVTVLPFVPGASTSNTLNKMAQALHDEKVGELL